jgi:hypothetical protein
MITVPGDALSGNRAVAFAPPDARCELKGADSMLQSVRQVAIRAALALSLMLGSGLVLVACGGCTPKNGPVKVSNLELKAYVTPTTPATLDVGCYTYWFQVAWQGYKRAHAFYRVGALAEDVKDAKYSTLVTRTCHSGTCTANAKVTSPTKEDAFLYIEPEKDEHIQETAQAICRITVFASDGTVIAVANRQEDKNDSAALSGCRVDF